MTDLSKYLDLMGQSSAALQGEGAQREAGVNKIKTDNNYDAELKGLNETRKTVLNTEKILSDLPRNVKQRTAGRLVTAAQQARIIGNEQQPITEQLGNLGRTTQAQQGNVDLIGRLIDQYVGGRNTDLQNKLTGLKTGADAEFTKYQTDSAAEQSAQEKAYRDMLFGYQKQQDAFSRGVTSKQLKMQEEDRKTAKEKETKGQTAAYLKGTEDQAASYAANATAVPIKDATGNIVNYVPGKVGSKEYKKAYNEFVKSQLTKDKSIYGDMNVDPSLISAYSGSNYAPQQPSIMDIIRRSIGAVPNAPWATQRGY